MGIPDVIKDEEDDCEERNKKNRFKPERMSEDVNSETGK